MRWKIAWVLVVVAVGCFYFLVNKIEDVQADEVAEYPAMPTEEEFVQNNIVNINTASAGELETLPGIGPSKAAAIIDYRELNDGFETIEEIMEVKGIGEKTYEGLKANITVE